MSTKRLYRSDKDRVLAGIFGGLGKYFNVDPVVLRIVWIFVLILTAVFPGIIAYLIAIIIIPKKSA